MTLPVSSYRQPLLDAVNANQVEAADEILKTANAKAGTDDHRQLLTNLLHIAVLKNNEEMISVLLNHHADTTELNDNKYTPVMYASQNYNWRILQIFLNHPSAPPIRPYDLSLALIYAIENGNKANDHNIEIISQLIERGIDFNYYRHRRTPVSLAAQMKKWNIVRHIATLHKAVPTNYDCTDYGSALLIAVENNEYDIVRILIDANADKFQLRYDRYNALHIAVTQNNLDIARLLLNNNADTDFINDDGLTPLQLAEKKNNREMAKLIADHTTEHPKRMSIQANIELRKKSVKDAHETIELINKHMSAINQYADRNKDITNMLMRIYSNNLNPGLLKAYKDADFIGNELKSIYTLFVQRLCSIKSLLEQIVADRMKLPEDIALLGTYNAVINIIDRVSNLNSKDTLYTSNAFNEIQTQIRALCTNQNPLTKVIASLFSQTELVSDYIKRARNVLSEIRTTCSGNVWRKRTVWGVKSAKPKHIKMINDLLNQCDYPDSTGSELNLFRQLIRVAAILSSIKPNRHRDPETQRTYDELLQKIVSLSLEIKPYEIDLDFIEANQNSNRPVEPSAPPLDASTDLSQDPPPYDCLYHQIVPPYLYHVVFQSAIDYSPQVLPLEPSAQPLDVNAELSQSPPRYESLYPQIEGPERLPANLYPALERSMVQPSAQALPHAQSPATQQNNEVAAPEQSLAPVTENLRQSTATIFQAIGMPANDAQFEYVPPRIPDEEAHVETEEERVSRALKDLAEAPEAPQTPAVMPDARRKVIGFAS